MLLSNLKVLLAERNLTISKVSNDTGISRTTLTALSNNAGAGIQFDTLDTLCQYLKITPKEFFLYYNSNLKIECHSESDNCFSLYVEFYRKHLNRACEITYCHTKSDDHNVYIDELEINVGLFNDPEDNGDLLTSALPLPVKQIIEEKIFECAFNEISYQKDNLVKSDKTKISIIWE